MEVWRNPGYLKATAQSVTEFMEALERFLDLHVFNDSLARGVAPAVWPMEKADPQEIKRAASEVDLAAGLASAATALTQGLVQVDGLGHVDPIAAWRTITQPKPVLEPDDIRSACGQMIGRLQQMIVKVEAEAPPRIGAEAMHPLIWAAAKRLWKDGNFRESVVAASEHLVGHLKDITGRRDMSDTALWQEAFSTEGPAANRPRLRWPGDPNDRAVRSMLEGLRQFAPGVQLTIRNSAAHSTAEMGEQDALERLAVLSLLARWVDGCDILKVT